MSALDFSLYETSGLLVIAPSGRLDAESATVLREKVQSLSERRRSVDATTMQVPTGVVRSRCAAGLGVGSRRGQPSARVAGGGLRQLEDWISNGPAQPARKERRQSNGHDDDANNDFSIKTKQFQKCSLIVCPQVKNAKLILFLNDRLGEQQATIGKTAFSRRGKLRQRLCVFRFSEAGEKCAVGQNQ